MNSAFVLRRGMKYLSIILVAAAIALIVTVLSFMDDRAREERLQGGVSIHAKDAPAETVWQVEI